MSVVKKILRKTFLKKIVDHRRNVKKAKNAINKFYGNEIGNKEKRKLVKEMIFLNKEYFYGYDEFCYLGFKDLTMEQRLEFVSDWQRSETAKKMNQNGNLEIFDDKEKTLQYFERYFKRDVCSVTNEKSFDAFEKFCAKHNRFIVKPVDSCFGRGVEIVTIQKSIKETFYELLEKRKNGFLAEQLIVQVDEMAKFHPQSCNTVRIPTIRFDDRVEVIHPFLRVGRGDSVVDNAGSGGIIVAVDAQTGITIAAADEKGKSYTKHPETEYDLIGFKIPRWNEAIELVKELAQIIPMNRYTGWDVALTNDGWAMVEGNSRGQFVWQVATKKGFKQELDEIMKELNL